MVSLQPICVPATAISGNQYLRSAVTGTLLDPCAQTATAHQFHSQQTSNMKLSATSNTVTRPVGERLQADTEDVPVLD